MRKPKVIDIKTRKPVFIKSVVDVDQFLDMLGAVESIAGELGYKPHDIIKEMEFNGRLSYEFLQKYYDQLEELLYELYERVQTKF
jgi:hypothetical protein